MMVTAGLGAGVREGGDDLKRKRRRRRKSTGCWQGKPDWIDDCRDDDAMVVPRRFKAAR
jgi:hypothetical protein